MDQLKEIENLFQGEFNILDGLPNYIAFEERETFEFRVDVMEEKLDRLNTLVSNLGLKRISMLIDRSSKHHPLFVDLLSSMGYEKYASQIQYRRSLDDISERLTYNWRSIGDGDLSEQVFQSLWARCMEGTQNKPSSLSIEEHMDSVKTELGNGWEHSCHGIFSEGQPIGISIPHIEPGTTDEGRLFYFGILPAERTKGHGAKVHFESLQQLKQMAATYYVGSTHETNKKMQHVFSKNGCIIQSYTESYYQYLNGQCGGG